MWREAMVAMILPRTVRWVRGSVGEGRWGWAREAEKRGVLVVV
jgi:hypothetical protein